MMIYIHVLYENIRIPSPWVSNLHLVSDASSICYYLNCDNDLFMNWPKCLTVLFIFLKQINDLLGITFFVGHCC